MADKPNKNDKPGKGNKDNKPTSSDSQEKMTASEILLMTILQKHHPDGITDEEWAALAPIGTRNDSAAKEYYGELVDQHAYTTKDFVRRPVVIKKRKRVPKNQPIPDLEDDYDDLDDGDDAPALTLPRPSQTRPGTLAQRTRAPRAPRAPPAPPAPPSPRLPRGTGAAKGKGNAKTTKEGGKPASPSASKGAISTRPAAKRNNEDPAPAGPSKRQAKAQGNKETAPASPRRRSPSPGDSFDESTEGEELLMEGLARMNPMSAVGREYFSRQAERRQAREREGSHSSRVGCSGRWSARRRGSA
ncbi:hypothetical protein PG991_010817 [Apiospora marii]|uniref:Uncharacterized protein n=1 Tax=Apiospora marii TaxID=335849 RepID=A0ABR1REG2_9PEZI